jgi:hypothetical protein
MGNKERNMIRIETLRELFNYNYWARDRQLGVPPARVDFLVAHDAGFCART